MARVKEIGPIYAHPVNPVAIAAQALGFFIVAVLTIWLMARYNAYVMLGPRVRRIARTLGLMTYPLYLTHEAVGGTVASGLSRVGVSHATALLSALAATALASYLVVIAIEPWLRRWLMALVHPRLLCLTEGPRFARIMGSFSTKTSKAGASAG